MSGQGRPKTTIFESRPPNAGVHSSPFAGSAAIFARSLPTLLQISIVLQLLAAQVSAQPFMAQSPVGQSLDSSTVERADDVSDAIDLRLRLSLGGGEPARWQGQMTVAGERSSLANLQPLGLDQHAVAAIRLDGPVLQIDHRIESDYNGVDVNVRGTASTELKIVLRSNDLQNAIYHTVRLADLVSAGWSQSIDATGNRLTIDRVAGDRLRVEFDRPHLVFDPQETARFSVRPHRTKLASGIATCRLEIFPARSQPDTAALWRNYASFRIDATGSADAQQLAIPVPEDEGVYDLRLTLTPDEAVALADGEDYERSSTVQRNVQLVVLSLQPPADDDHDNWQLVRAVDVDQMFSASPNKLVDSLSKSLAKPMQWLSRDNPQTNGFAGNNLRQRIDEGNGKMLRLEPGGWQSIPLSFDDQNHVYRIEVDYVRAADLALGVSLLQADASGQIASLGPDSGVFSRQQMIPPDPVAESTVQTHRFLHWPNKNDGSLSDNGSGLLLVIANRHADHAATIGAIRVYRGPARLGSMPRNDPAQEFDGPTRRLMAFCEVPNFPENFGAGEHTDASAGQPLDDWVTFYDGADRLVQYLKSSGMAGAFVTVAIDGSSIYPSRMLHPGPRYDTGLFRGDDSDVMRKDVVELLFRMFQREGLQFVPVLTLNAALPQLEATLFEGQAGLLVDYADNTATPGQVRNLPRYHALDLQVQQAVNDVLNEFCDRYKHHATFTGVATTLSPETCTLLPGQQWGYDDQTVRRFVDEMQRSGIAIDEPTAQQLIQQPQLRSGLLLGALRDSWLGWRAERMSAWYRELRDIVRGSIPGGTLFLAPVDLYQNPEISAAISPGLHTSSDFADLMLRLGLQPELLIAAASNDGLTVLNPHRKANGRALAERRVDRQVDHSRKASDFFADGQFPGDVFVHRNRWVHFAQLQNQPFLPDQRGPLMRLQPLTLVGELNRQRFIERVKQSDSRLLVDGGRLLPVSDQSDSLRRFTPVFTRLPDVPFDDVPLAGQDTASAEEVAPWADGCPVAVRQTICRGRRWIYAVNASPWPVTVRCRLSDSSEEYRSLSETEFQETGQVGGRQITIQLQPWDLAAASSVGSSATVIDFQYQLPANADLSLRKEIYRLQSKLIRANHWPAIESVTNPGFEKIGPSDIGGWTTGPEQDNSVQLTTSDPLRGQHCASIVNQNETPVWIRSNEFATPTTGRLSISVWLRTRDAQQQPPLRIAVEGRAGGHGYYRFGSIGSLSPDPTSNQVGPEWRRFAVHFDDLPLTDMEHVRIGFDLMGSGQVDIDDVSVYDRWFDENDSKAMTQLLASAGTLLSSDQTFNRCRQVLESYWPRFLAEHFDDDLATAQQLNSRVPAREASFLKEADSVEPGESPIQRPSDDSSIDATTPAAANEANAATRSGQRFRNIFRTRKLPLR